MYQDLKIEKGLPIPAHPKRGSGITCALRKMSVGDSFLVPADDIDIKLQSTITAQCSQFARNKAFKFTTRRVEGGYRVWKISRDTTT